MGNGPTDSKMIQAPALAKLHIWQFQAVRDVLLVIALIALVWLGYAMRSITVPLLVALLLAYLFEPLVAWMTRHPKISRPVAVGGLLATVGTILVVIVFLVASVLINETNKLINEIREGRMQERLVALQEFLPETQREQFEQWFNWLLPEPIADEEDSLEELLEQWVPAEERAEDEDESDEDDRESDEEALARESGEEAEAAEDLDEELIQERLTEERLRAIVRDELRQRDTEGERPEAGTGWGPANWFGVARGGAGAVMSFIGGLITIGFILFLIPFYFFFFSISFPRITEFGRSLVPEKQKSRTLELLGKMDRVIAAFVRGQFTIGLIMGVLFAIGWSLCGVPYAIVIGLVTGIFCIVPYLGVIGLPVAVGMLLAYSFEPGTGFAMPVWQILLFPTLVYTAVQLLESYVLTPTIAGKVTNLDPVTIVVAVLAGGSIMGIYGMLLAVPTAACLKILIREVLLPKIRAWTKGEAADPLPIGDE